MLIKYNIENGGVGIVEVVLDGEPRAITELKVQKFGKRSWKTLADFVWYDGTNILRARREYTWDGANVPQIFRWYEGVGEHLAASLLHDYTYNYHEFIVWDARTESWIRKKVAKSDADALWRQILEKYYVCDETRSEMLWAAVAIGGWWNWIKYRAYHDDLAVLL